jgi:molecular chaperone GrpE
MRLPPNKEFEAVPENDPLITDEAPMEDSADLNDDVQTLRDALARIADERDQAKDQLLRTMADFQNFRKRQDEQRARMQEMATERVLVDLLPILDNFERTVASIERGATMESVAEGVRAVEKQMKSVLESHGLKRLHVVGEPFDPEHHDAIGVETSEEHEHDTVMAELEPGYKMGERTVRPARVRVAKRP